MVENRFPDSALFRAVPAAYQPLFGSPDLYRGSTWSWAPAGVNAGAKPDFSSESGSQGTIGVLYAVLLVLASGAVSLKIGRSTRFANRLSSYGAHFPSAFPIAVLRMQPGCTPQAYFQAEASMLKNVRQAIREHGGTFIVADAAAELSDVEDETMAAPGTSATTVFPATREYFVVPSLDAHPGVCPVNWLRANVLDPAAATTRGWNYFSAFPVVKRRARVNREGHGEQGSTGRARSSSTAPRHVVYLVSLTPTGAFKLGFGTMARANQVATIFGIGAQSKDDVKVSVLADLSGAWHDIDTKSDFDEATLPTTSEAFGPHLASILELLGHEMARGDGELVDCDNEIFLPRAGST